MDGRLRACQEPVPLCPLRNTEKGSRQEGKKDWKPEGGWTDTSVAREQAPYPQVISAPARGLLWGSDPAGCELPQGLQEARRLSVRLCSACQARILGRTICPGEESLPCNGDIKTHCPLTALSPRRVCPQRAFCSHTKLLAGGDFEGLVIGYGVGPVTAKVFWEYRILLRE